MSLPSDPPTTAPPTRLFSNPIRPPLFSQQQQQPLYGRSSARPQLPKTNGAIYPSPRLFLPRSEQGMSPFPPRPNMGYPVPAPVPSWAFPNSDLGLALGINLVKPTHNLFVSNGAPAKGLPLSGQPKVVPPHPPSLVSDCNGHKDARARTRDDNILTVKDRKVKTSKDSSLYALCRSWLKNGFPEEAQQPQYMDSVKSLPRPLPTPVEDAHSPINEEGDKKEEDDQHVEDLSPQELLQIHIKRAKRVRAGLREERLKRIARYKTRLALLLPPIVEQQLRNDTTS